MGTSFKALWVLEMSRPTKIDVALSELKISATPLANTTTRLAENSAESFNVMEVTSF